MESRILHSLAEVKPEDWDRLVPDGFPFARHGFLFSLELSQCVGAGTGWEPHYATFWQGEALQAAFLLYRKWDSYGEFIFDWEWARAYQRYGKKYYPKFVSALPLTPITAPKVLLAPGVHLETIVPHLEKLFPGLLQANGASSLHLLYLPESELQHFQKSPFLLAKNLQFAWTNRGYQDFADFLASLRRKKRVQIQRERRRVETSGLEMRTLVGAQVETAHMEKMFEFYLGTHDKRGGLPYLNREFFLTLRERLGEALVLTTAWNGAAMVAASMHLRSSHALYGRYWGCETDYRDLHFELSYYQAIEYALSQGFDRVEAGAQGFHKFLRGYDPEWVYSLHWIEDPAFQEAIARSLAIEVKEMEFYFNSYQEHSAYKE